MKTDSLQPVLRADYRQPNYWIEQVDLHFDLHEDASIVRSRIRFVRNEAAGGSAPLALRGEQLQLESVAVDGRPLAEDEYRLADEQLVIEQVPERFETEIVVKIRPQDNTTMMGLYKSSGNFCTQCEAEGFRRITYFLDRPDVMARYTTTIEADRTRYPVLLSNGNRVEEGDAEGGRHWVRWEDPFPKPSYLFALVAGNLLCHRGEFVTRSGRKVDLEIWVEPQNIDACEHALTSLQKSMKWDEEVFGLEYDLDLYMIVAVNDFNMGAMENKGLNIFNTKYVLAKPETATDSDYEDVERVIAHEYFHNWTGNRVTCRDWFQLTLKEGLTVFRDQLFSADMSSAAVKRISEVRSLRSSQFAEDAGPMAHPIRPESYVEMNNFYTSTVYNKGAEVIRMYHTLLGPEGFRRGMDLYFERHDGGAVECDDFLAAMADANDADLSQFARWYSQAGTPTVEAEGQYDADTRRYSLILKQSSPQTPGLEQPLPLQIPVRTGLLGPDGRDLPLRLEGEADEPGGAAAGEVRERVLELREPTQTFTFVDVPQAPVPSLLRGFSAPVKLEMRRSIEESAFLMAHDSDPFNRWDAGQELAQRLLLGLAADAAAGRPLSLEPLFVEAFRRILLDAELDGSLKSLAVGLPSEILLGQRLDVVDVDAVHAARQFALRELAASLRDDWQQAYQSHLDEGPYSNDRASIDRRRIKNTALAYLVRTGEEQAAELAASQHSAADNMTDALAALACLTEFGGPRRDRALADFHGRWRHEPLVLDKWFSVQAVSSLHDTFDRVRELAAHEDFTLENPNRARSLLGAFAHQNQVRFHDSSGEAYRFLADKVLELDRRNPQVAARLVSAFNQWRRFDTARQQLMEAQLTRIAAEPKLSKDVSEIVGRCLA